MTDAHTFAIVVALASAALLLAVFSHRITEWTRVPAPALFLVLAAAAAQVFPQLRRLPLEIDERIVTVALLVILFDGGMHMGLARFRTAAGAVVWIGVAGTLVTLAALTLAGHAVFHLSWLTSLILGTALSPTDPAVVFSVLGRQEIRGRSGTILEGESGANDPVGIAVMVAVLGAVTGGAGGGRAVLSGVGTFALQLAVGAVVGLLGGWGLRRVMRLILPNESLHLIRTLAAAGAVYGVAGVLGGSGFLAVLIAGIVVGDVRAPYKREIERFFSGLAGLAEIVAFVVLGLTVSLDHVVRGSGWWIGLLLAALLVLVVRPVFVGLLSLPVRLPVGERVFVLFAGLKGAVPILLALLALTAGTADSELIYDIVFVVVLVSVAVQGGLTPSLLRWCRVPTDAVEQRPWALGLRFRTEPTGWRRQVVAPGSAADGARADALALPPGAWCSMAGRDGELLNPGADLVLRAGDEVLVLDVGTGSDQLFAGPAEADPGETGGGATGPGGSADEPAPGARRPEG